MQIKADQLASRLKQATLPLIWISGDETLLVQEACDTVRQSARAQGYAEREVMDAGSNISSSFLPEAANLPVLTTAPSIRVIL